MPDPEIAKGVVSGTFDYFKGQPFNNLLIAVLIALIAAGFGYGLPWAVREAKSGARELMGDCAKEREAREKRFSADLHELGERFERSLDRQQGKPAQANAVGVQVPGTDDGGRP